MNDQRWPSSLNIDNKYHWTWLVRSHLPCVVKIEKLSPVDAWSARDFERYLHVRDNIGMVTLQNDRVVGFVVYKFHKTTIEIAKFAVHPNFRRQGVGTHMMLKMIAKLRPTRQNSLLVIVRETNLAAQLFLRVHRFRANTILHGYYDDPPEDAYRLMRRWSTEDKPAAI